MGGGAGAAAVDALRGAGVARGRLVALAVAPDGDSGVGLATVDERGPGLRRGVAGPGAAAVVAEVERALRPRWVVWSQATAQALVSRGARLATCWDVAAVHRLLVGGWRAGPARAWAVAHALDVASIPAPGPPDLFSLADAAGRAGGPRRDDGHLDPEWVEGGWAKSPEALATWASLAAEVAALQRQQLASLPAADRALATARSESAAELLCAELAADGLPFDRDAAEAVIGDAVGPRPRDDAEAASQRARRDAQVLRLAPAGVTADLRSPAQVRALLRHVGLDLADTRAWRLEAQREAHPLVDALLRWRKAERMATTFGFAWLDEHLGADGRLRGTWSGADGAAGRMTASAGLHNMPAELRRAVRAEPGHVFVRADLGQVEPRVLAAVSGDAALARAGQADDLYAPVAHELGVDRATAKVAVLGALYGQTTGRGGQVLPRLWASYPVAMRYLEAAAEAGQRRRDLRTYGGRLVRLGGSDGDEDEGGGAEARRRAAARGRYARNALVQGAAAELFKVWAATVRARAGERGAQIVLCLHDELLVHAPTEAGAAVADLVTSCLQEAARRWAPDTGVRFVAEVQVLQRWSDAKA